MSGDICSCRIFQLRFLSMIRFGGAEAPSCLTMWKEFKKPVCGSVAVCLSQDGYLVLALRQNNHSCQAPRTVALLHNVMAGRFITGSYLNVCVCVCVGGGSAIDNMIFCLLKLYRHVRAALIGSFILSYFFFIAFFKSNDKIFEARK